MTRYILRRGGRVLATALFTGALFLGFVAPTAAGEFILWNGVFAADGSCKVTAVDQSADIILFTGSVPDVTCSGIKAAIQKLGERQTHPIVCEQQPTQSHIVPPPPLDFSPGKPDFLQEELKDRVFRVGVSGEARCDFPSNNS